MDESTKWSSSRFSVRSTFVFTHDSIYAIARICLGSSMQKARTKRMSQFLPFAYY